MGPLVYSCVVISLKLQVGIGSGHWDAESPIQEVLKI